MTQPTRVVVAMSGGVDSSVAAALLVERGYEVVGVMLRLWSESDQGERPANRCCTLDAQYEAALGQLDALLELDPINYNALILKDGLEDMVYFRKEND